MINTRIATGTAPKIKTFIDKHSHCYWNSSSKSKHSLAKYQGIFTDKFKTLVNIHFYSSSKSKY
ncbi:hypothetical protein J2Q15_09315 [Tenacibaculum finnmarkense genomovar finnmarkense]|nr:hypothetical protein [Tenacibaculum finnmarkense genomovar finnmarkense]